VLPNYWKQDASIAYINPRCYLLRRDSFKIVGQPDKAILCAINKQYAVKQCHEKRDSNLTVSKHRKNNISVNIESIIDFFF
jgi:hypothetical protein